MASLRPEILQTSAKEAPEHPFFRKLAQFVLRHRAWLLFLNCVLTAAAAWAVYAKLRMDLSSEPFLPADSHSRMVTEQFKDDFGHDLYSQVIVGGDVFTLDYLQRLKAFHEDLAAVDVEIPSLGQRGNNLSGHADPPPAPLEDEFGDFGDEGWGDEAGGSIFEEVTSLVNVRQTRGTEGGVLVEGLLDEWPAEEDLPALRERALSDRTLVGRVLGEDGKHSAVILRTDHMNEEDSVLLYDAIKQVAAKHQADGFDIQVAGLPAVIARITTMTKEDVATLFMAATLMMVVVLAVVFRHPLGVAGPILAVIQSALWASGVQALLDKPWTQASNIIPAFLICVGIGDAVHIQSAYRAQLRAGEAHHEAIVRAVATTGVPVLFTTLTTFIGLASFQFADAVAIRDVGLTGGLGVIVAMLQCLVVVPIFLSMHRRGNFGASADEQRLNWMDRLLTVCDHASSTTHGTGRRNAVLALAVITVAVFGYGATTVYVSHDDLRHIPPDDPAKLATLEADEALGGTGGLSLYIKAPPGETLADRELMLGLQKLQAHIEDYEDPVSGRPLVSNITSLLDVVRETHRALMGGDQAAYRVPDTQRGVVDMLTLFQNSGPDELSRLATVDLTHSRMDIRARWIDAKRYIPFNEHVMQGVRRYIGDKAEVIPTGTGHMFVEVTNMALRDMIRSFSIAFAVVTLLMVVMLRSLKLAVLAMLPNLLPIVAVLGLMGFTNIWLDYSNVLIASIALGIVVDDTIHFLHQFRAQYVATGNVEAGLAHAFSHSGRAMIITSLVLLCGFVIFTLAQLGNVRIFGLLVALTVVFALFVDLILAPALLRKFYRSAVQRETETPLERSAAGYEGSV